MVKDLPVLEVEFVDLIRSCDSVTELSEKLGVGRTKVYSFLSELVGYEQEVISLRERGKKKAVWKYKFDEEFFLKDSKEFYYILGYIAGDGCLTKPKYGEQLLRVCSTDLDFMESLKVHIKSNHPIFKFKKQKDQHSQCYGIGLFSTKVCSRLQNLGIPLEKSECKDWDVSVPEEFKIYFYRGLLDSDGCVSVNKNRLGVTALHVSWICSSWLS